jgi:hypothetical protein
VRDRADPDARERKKRIVRAAAFRRRISLRIKFWYVCHGQNALVDELYGREFRLNPYTKRLCPCNARAHDKRIFLIIMDKRWSISICIRTGMRCVS